ncbi:uncharacterized protein LOC128884233 [Hylaeus volcanicus]|uniref:uncharacterized protein LOC128884233 n=1 Tax=Hylaeus volcanicus TaxID=313075 RepID=UPI0023B8649E|nr:uncharacterized protein LOC128884233 [Hylaeus volcanicus]
MDQKYIDEWECACVLLMHNRSGMQGSHFSGDLSNRWSCENFQECFILKKNQQKNALHIENKMTNSFVDVQPSSKRLCLDVLQSHPKTNKENYICNESMYENKTKGLHSFQKSLFKEKKNQSSVNKEHYSLDQLTSCELADVPKTGLCNDALKQESFNNTRNKNSCTSSPIYRNTNVQVNTFWKENDFNLNGLPTLSHPVALNDAVFLDLKEKETELSNSEKETVSQQIEKTLPTKLETSCPPNIVKDYLNEQAAVCEKSRKEDVLLPNTSNSLETNDLQNMGSWIHPSEPETSDRLSCFLNLSPKQLANMLLESVGFSNDSTLCIEKSSGGNSSQTVKSLAPLQAAPSLAAATSAAATLLGFSPNDSCINNTFIKPTLLNETFGFYSDLSSQTSTNSVNPLNKQRNENFLLGDVSSRSYIESQQVVVEEHGPTSSKGSYVEEIHLKNVSHEERPLTEKEYFSSPSKNIYSHTTLENVEEKSFIFPLREANSDSHKSSTCSDNLVSFKNPSESLIWSNTSYSLPQGTQDLPYRSSSPCGSSKLTLSFPQNPPCSDMKETVVKKNVSVDSNEEQYALHVCKTNVTPSSSLNGMFTSSAPLIMENDSTRSTTKTSLPFPASSSFSETLEDGFQGDDDLWYRRPDVDDRCLEQLCDLVQLKKHEKNSKLFVEYERGVSFPLGEGGRELLRACLNVKGCKGRRLQGASVPVLLKLAYDWGLWNIAIRIKIERVTGDLCPKHEAFVRFKAMQSHLRKYLKREQMHTERDGTGQITDIRFEEMKYLTLGKEGREKLRTQLRRLHDRNPYCMDALLERYGFKYSELRNATVPQLLKMAHICCMWNEVIDACKKQEAKRDCRFVQKQDKIPVLSRHWMNTFSSKQNETSFPSIQSVCTKWAPTSTASVAFSSVPIGTLSSEPSNSPQQTHPSQYTETMLHSQTTRHSSSSNSTISPSKRHQSLETLPSLSSAFSAKHTENLFQSNETTPNHYATVDSNPLPCNADEQLKASMPQCSVNINEKSTYDKEKVDVNPLSQVASEYKDDIKEALVSNQHDYSRTSDRSYFRSVIHGQSICSITSY